MKLPNIQYQQRAATAKVDPRSYVRLGEAKASISKAVGDAAQEYYEQDAVSEMQASELNYNELMDDMQMNQSPSVLNSETGKREGAWVNGRKNFEQDEREIRQTVLEGMDNRMGKKLFNERANKRFSDRRNSNNARLIGLKKENDLATLQTVVDSNMGDKRFEPAREAIVQAAVVGTISETQAQSQIKKIFYEEKYYNFGLESDEVGSGKDLNKFREKVGSSSLKETDKKRLTAKADMQIIDANLGEMNSTIQDVESSDGGTPAKAYAAGRKRLDKIMRTSAKTLGGDESFKQRIYIANKIILDQYNVKVQKQAVLDKRQKNQNDYTKGYIGASPNNNEVAYSDNFLRPVMGYKRSGKSGYDNDYENPDPDNRAVTKDEFLSNANGVFDKYVSYAAKNGHQVQEMRSLLNTALTDKNGEQSILAAKGIYKLYKANPTSIFSDGKSDNMGMVATQIELAGGGEGSYKKAVSIMRKYNSLSKDERDALVGSKKDNDEYFDSKYEEVLEKLYPDSSLFSSAPATQRKYRLLARKSFNTQLSINNGIQSEALAATLMTMKTSWATSNTSGDEELMQNSPEATVIEGTHKGGGWLRRQGLAVVEKKFPKADTDTLRFEGVEKFDKQNPLYNMYIKVDGMDRLAGIIRFNRTKTPEYKAEKKQKEAEEKANFKNEEDNRLREEWNLENPKEVRERDKAEMTASGRGIEAGNPYGEDPSRLSPIGKAVKGFSEGMKGQASAAKIANKTIKAIRKKRLAKEEQTAKTRTRKPIYRGAP